MDMFQAFVFGFVVSVGGCTHVEPCQELEFEMFGEFQGRENEVCCFCCFDQFEDTGWEGFGWVALCGGGTRMSVRSLLGMFLVQCRGGCD